VNPLIFNAQTQLRPVQSSRLQDHKKKAFHLIQ